MAEELTECANVIADWDKKMGEIRNRIERYSERKRRESAGNRTCTDYQSGLKRSDC